MKKIVRTAFVVLLAGCGGKELEIGGTPAPTPAMPDGGHASELLVARQRNARSLVSDGPYLYWIADEDGATEARRCEKSNCTGTQMSFFRLTGDNHLGRAEIRGDTLYLVGSQSVLSCSLSDCSAPSIIVAKPVLSTAPSAAFDDSNLYWATLYDGAILSCPLTGCDHAATRVVGTTAAALAVDATRLFWTKYDTTNVVTPTAVMFAPKGGSASSPEPFATGQERVSALVLRDGFIHWTTTNAAGTVARCPVAGCTGGTPEVLINQQDFPSFLNIDGEMAFWMNGAGPLIDRPAEKFQIRSCERANCAGTLSVVLEEPDGAPGAPRDKWLPPLGMIVDSESIYWIGDAVDEGSTPSSGPVVGSSIRRIERPRGRQ